MIQTETNLFVCDNSGAKSVRCIKILGSSKKRYAYFGDFIKVVVKKINNNSKIKNGEVLNAILIRSFYNFKRLDGTFVNFNENSVVLLNSKNELLFTRVFGPVLRELKFLNYLGDKILPFCSIII